MRPNISLILIPVGILSGCLSTPKSTETQLTPTASPQLTPPTASRETLTPAPIGSKTPPPKHAQFIPSPDYRAQGLASWYTLAEHGKKTASGTLYDMYAMTAAHATLPFLTHVEVRHLSTGQRVVVTITDRLSTADNVLIKLSHEAARRLKLLDTPHPKVDIRYLPPFTAIVED